METIKTKIFNTNYLVYLALLLLNLIIFVLTGTFSIRDPFAIFWVHYICAAGAFLVAVTFLRKKREGLMSVVLLLFMISCYSLNRGFELFDSSAPWFCAVLLLISANLLLFRFYAFLPRPMQWLLLLVMGLGLVTWVYLALYLIPWYGVSIPGLLVIGLSIHTFIPALLILHAILLIRKQTLQLPARLALALGIALPLAAVVIFTARFTNTAHRLNRTFHQQQASADDLPAWVKAAMRLPDNGITNKVLKSGLVYRTADMDNFLFGIPRRRTDEPLVHDPLVTIGMLCSPPLTLDEDSRLRILETRFNNRHHTQERRWRGDDLKTTYVNTRVQIWPAMHLSYTEKMISVYNTSGWGQQEGIYSFQLPEGAVVTSLSLWINGKEEKSILTTREKADSAYRTIVGVEARDPSLVRWQEGNTVSVRVFPVEHEQSRQFKLGFTAPLAADGPRLAYRNSWFSGPYIQNTPEDIVVEFMSPPAGVTAPGNFRRNGNSFTSEGSYNPGWEITMADEGLQHASFSFNGYEYTLKPYAMQRVPTVINTVYLDLNAAWTPEECRQVLAMAGSRPVFAWLNGRMLPLNPKYVPTLNQPFSLFPVHRIPDPNTALLITKSTGISPHLSDLAESAFGTGLAAWLRKPEQGKVRLLNIGGELSPYLRTLKEQRVFRYEKGGLLLVKVLLDTQQFAADAETPAQVVIDEANVAITKQPGTGSGKAPDHLMRLFAYNHIMQQKGRGAMPDSLVALAQEAYVVTPLTSLVVLETQKDYDRFGIKDSGNSLKNASSKSNGAVPEPHEWALIILALLTLLYVKFKPTWNRPNA